MNRPTKKHFLLLGAAIALLAGTTFFLWGVFGPAPERGVRAAGGIMAEGWMEGWSTDSAGTDIYVDTNPAGPGWVSLNHAAFPRYGLEFIERNSGAQAGQERGYLQGYAWTPTLGWISFEAADVAGCPEAPCEPKLVSQGGSNYIFRGWARILSLPQAALTNNAGGFEGWIRLSSPPRAVCPPPGSPPGPTGCPYGVRVSNGTFPQNSSFAWSNEFGWLRFRGRLPVGSALVPACIIGADPGQRRISRANPTATSSLTWGCTDVVPNTCQLSWDKISTTVTGKSNGGIVQEREASGVLTRFSTSTMYTIQCDSTIPGQPKATANASINVIYPSGIIEVPSF